MTTTVNQAPILAKLLAANAQWAEDVEDAEPGFFEISSKGQSPKILWIGCADSRVPESVVTGAKPGDIFVHRNVANQVHLNDDNLLAVLQYAVDTVGVEHILVVGHTNCGGVNACHAAASTTASSPAPGTPLGRWLEPLTTLARNSSSDDANAIVEANVQAQVNNLANTDTMQNVWKKGKDVKVHGWVYQLHSGKLKDLGITIGKDGK
ncbi:carbonic anhydrase [Panus rudis PR-1116 ss-1]|nr:carbonic anhydrase [Panus rudis PR-1116 ss-1]